MAAKYTAMDLVHNDGTLALTEQEIDEIKMDVSAELDLWDNFTRQEFLKLVDARLLPMTTIHEPFVRRGLASFGHSLRYQRATFISKLGEFYGEVLVAKIRETRK